MVLKAVDDALRAQTGNRKIDDVRRVLLSDQDKTGHIRERLAAQVAQLLHMGDLRVQPRQLLGARRAEAADTGEIFRSGTVIALLPAAQNQRRQRKRRTDVERANALGGMDLMPGDGDQVRAQRFGFEGDLEKALYGIGVEQRQRTEPARCAEHFRNWHDRAGLIVDHHDRDQDGVRAERGAQLLDGDEASFVRLKVCDLKALRLQLLHGMQDRVMLDRGGDDVMSALAEALRRAAAPCRRSPSCPPRCRRR